MKRVILQVLTMFLVSGSLLFVGYFFHIKLFMISYYEETSTGWKTGGSILAFVIGAICCYIIDKIYCWKRDIKDSI